MATPQTADIYFLNFESHNDKNWPHFKKKIVSVGFMSAKQITANNWKAFDNINIKTL